jgi:hypothetical protein
MKSRLIAFSIGEEGKEGKAAKTQQQQLPHRARCERIE